MRFQSRGGGVMQSVLFTYRVGNSLIRSSLFRWNSLILNSVRSLRSYKRAMWVICSWIEKIAPKKRAIRSTTKILFVCFWQFSPLLCPRANRSRRSWQKSDRERFAQVTHDKRATGAIHYSTVQYSSYIFLSGGVVVKKKKLCGYDKR